MLIQLLVAFNLGLFSTLHCVGMCGGVLSALMLSSAPEGPRPARLKYSLAFNYGRISSYALAGLLAGLAGDRAAALVANLNLHGLLQVIAALVLIGIALNMLGLLPFNRYLELFGARLWRRIQPVGRRLLPINTVPRGVLFGMLWGWLPCAMVYSALILSLTSGGAINGMLMMLFFGLGTLPGMISTGYVAGYLRSLQKNKPLRIVAALCLILVAISLPVSSLYFSGQHEHPATAEVGF